MTKLYPENNQPTENKMAAKPGKKKTNQKIALETRILATFSLIEICKTDAQNIGSADIEELYKKIAALNEKAFEDEKALDIVAEHGLDEIASVDHLKERIYRSRAINAYKQLGYFGLAGGSVDEHEMSGAEILATVMHEAGIKNADELSAAACSGELDDEGADRLHKELNGKLGFLKKRLAADYEDYQERKSKNSSVELIREDIEEYTFDKNKTASFEFSVRKKDYDFRCGLRDDFKRTTKPDFLKLYGTMLTEGKNAAQGSSFGSTYPAFREMIEKSVGKDAADAEIDQALGISPEEAAQPGIEAKRKAAYKEKCTELYFKTVAGLLSQKQEYNLSHNTNSDYRIYMQTIDNKYIRSLCNGENDIAALAFQDPDYKQQYESKAREHQLNREMRDETADMQIVSVHHKFPVGAVYDVYDQILTSHSEDLKKEKCSKLVNNRSNMVFVIGQDMHQSLEAKGKMDFRKNQDAMIFAARINVQALRSVMSQLPPYMREGLKKYVKIGENDKSKDISVNMKFSEPQEIGAIREKLNTSAGHVSVAQKYARYYTERQVRD